MEVFNLCRSCMKEVTEEEYNFDQETIKMFTFCTNIKVKVSEERLPHQFCKQCINSIQACFTFITTAREVDIKLKNIIGSVKSGVKPEIPKDDDFDPSLHDSGIKPEEYESNENIDFITIKDQLNSTRVDNNEKSWKENETKVEESNDLTDIIASPISSIEYKKHVCMVCNRSFYKKKNYEKHISKHKEISQAENKDVPNSAEENVAVKKYIRNRYQCPHCPEKYSSTKKLGRHKLKEHPNWPFKCSECDQEFREQRQLEAHQRRHDRLKYGRTCHECNKVFKSTSYLLRHMEMHEYTLRPYLCDICGSQYSQRQAMLNHQLVHTGQKPFTCEECGYTCRQSSNMRRHKRAHQNERKHQCVECGKGFNELCSLKKHMLWHMGKNQYKCPHCENVYRSPGNRRKHLIRGHGLDPRDIPRLAKDGGPARRYVTTEDHSARRPYSLLADRAKKSQTETDVESEYVH